MAMVAACGSQGEPGVNVKGLDADVVFGVKNKAGTQAPGAAPDQLAPDEEIALVAEDTVQPGGPRSFRQEVQRSEPCPEASINAFPKEASTEQVSEQPAPGRYRWQRGGTTKLAALQGQEVRITGFEVRVIENVTLTSESTNPATDYPDKRNFVYRYDTVQPYGKGTLRTTYQVKTNAEAQREVKPVTGDPRVRAGDPERGLAIVGEVYNTPDGGREERRFVPALLILPLPISPGEQFTSTSEVSTVGLRSDMTRQGAARFDGTIKAKERIDACGDIVEGYRVEGKMQQPGFTTAYNILVATQLGAMIIEEQYKFSDAFGTHDLRFELGQLVPTPLANQT
ncbi:MAG TPA: hypothetical protein VM938_12460 [Acidimicrobiales bacterium]|nr:hypothetical protein [Acidimicrobiales bacterium]